MRQNKLNSIAQDALVDLLLESTKELMTAFQKADNDIEIKEKKEQVELIHEALAESKLLKRTAERLSSGLPL